MENNALSELEKIIAARRSAAAENSYTAQLLQAAPEKLLKKIGEEATEVVIAAVGQGREAVLYESCDLIYHLMVLWAREGIALQDISLELARRFALSGLEEKANRK